MNLSKRLQYMDMIFLLSSSTTCIHVLMQEICSSAVQLLFRNFIRLVSWSVTGQSLHHPYGLVHQGTQKFCRLYLLWIYVIWILVSLFDALITISGTAILERKQPWRNHAAQWCPGHLQSTMLQMSEFGNELTRSKDTLIKDIPRAEMRSS